MTTQPTDQTLLDTLENCGVDVTANISMRVADIAGLDRLVMELEQAMADPTETDERKRFDNRLKLAEAIGKARDRWRKALSELESICARAGTPIERGIADELKPMLEHTADIVDKSIVD